MTVLVWFRNDLRVLDNAALHHAAKAARESSKAMHPLRAVYLLAPEQHLQHGFAPIKAHYLRRALDELAKNLGDMGVPLDFVEAPTFADAPAALQQYRDQHGVTEVHANAEHLVNEERRDAAVAEELGMPVKLHHEHLFFRPGDIRTQNGDPYRVFTPFSKNLRQRLRERPPQCYRKPRPLAEPLRNKPAPAMLDECNSDAWAVTEQSILAKLKHFAQERSPDYKAQRDLPAIDGTSQLSAELSLGLLTVRQCLSRLLIEQEEVWDSETGPGGWLNELVWREFYHHLYQQYPHAVMGHAFKRDYDKIRWNDSEDDFAAWCEGRTGFPIVDAAMRQLNDTGWMHNRLRMIAASFLIKDLHIDWRKGERYFMENLIDSDFASNNGGWQWASSSGCDAAPYFRIFNPTSQGKKFDPDGDFITRYIPELKGKTGKALHEPKDVDGYPAPIVDHKQARERTLEMYEVIKG